MWGIMRTGAVKPTWVVDKERAKRQAATETIWLFGLHAVRDALMAQASPQDKDKITRLYDKRIEKKRTLQQQLAARLAATGISARALVCSAPSAAIPAGIEAQIEDALS